jgi:hypothetical protein
MIYPKRRVFGGPILATLNVNDHTAGEPSLQELRQSAIATGVGMRGMHERLR